VTRQRLQLAVMSLVSVAALGLGQAGCTSANADGDAGVAADARVSEASPPADDLASLLAPIREQLALPALAALVLEGDVVVARGAVGVRKQGNATPVTVDDLFHLGSCTKAMTATLVASLVQEKLLAWEADLPAALPSLAGTMHADYAQVTLGQLLAHRGGVLGSLTAHPAIWNPLWTDNRPLTEQRLWLAQQALSLAPEVQAGEYLYSNAGYIIVGAAIEEATGEAWEAQLQKRVFDPLGMSSCGFGPPATAATVDQPWGHEVNGTSLEPVDPGALAADNPPVLGPAGTVHCSLDDWAKFAAVHLRGAQGQGTFLPTAAYTKMHAAWPGSGESYALGWLTQAASVGRVLSHAGSNGMFFAHVMLLPDRNVALLVATNRADQNAKDAVAAVTAKVSETYPGF